MIRVREFGTWRPQFGEKLGFWGSNFFFSTGFGFIRGRMMGNQGGFWDVGSVSGIRSLGGIRLGF